MLDMKGNKVTYFGHSTFSLTTPRHRGKWR